MIKTILIAIVILFAAILLMGMRVFFSKKGKFPDLHISNHDAMKERGITCATSQDREGFKKQNIFDKLETEKF